MLEVLAAGDCLVAGIRSCEGVLSPANLDKVRVDVDVVVGRLDRIDRQGEVRCRGRVKGTRTMVYGYGHGMN